MRSLFRYFTVAVVLSTASLCTAYSTEWRLNWVREFAGELRAAEDGVYVLGYRPGFGSQLAKYSIEGEPLWSVPADGGAKIFPTPSGVHLVWGVPSPSNNVFQSPQDYVVRKFDANGIELWQRRLTFSLEATYVDVTSDGFYFAGVSSDSAFVQKRDWNGNVAWSRQVGGGAYPQIGGMSAAPDGVYVSGTANRENSGSADAYLRKYDPHGNELWTRYQDGGTIQIGHQVLATTNQVYWKWAIASGRLWFFVTSINPDGTGSEGQLGTQLLPNSSGAVIFAKPDGIYVSHGFGDQATTEKFAGNAWGEIDVSTLLTGSAVVDTSDERNGRVYVAGTWIPPEMGFGGYRPFLLQAVTFPTTPRPVSWTLHMPAIATSKNFVVQWYGVDSGGGIRDYSIYVSDNGGPFTLWYRTPDASFTSGLFSGEEGHTYSFYSVALSESGALENPKTLAEATTRVAGAVKPVSRVSALPATAASPNFQVQWSGTATALPIEGYSIWVSDNGGQYSAWLMRSSTNQAWFSGLLGHTYRFFSIARDNAGNTENMKSGAEGTTQVPAVMAADVNGDLRIDCSDVAAVKASLGKKTGQPGFDARADVNKDGVVDIRDLAGVTQKLAPMTSCP